MIQGKMQVKRLHTILLINLITMNAYPYSLIARRP